MKRLKIILRHNFTCYFLIFVFLISYFICNNLNYTSSYDSFNDEKFVITNIVLKDYGVKLELRGKEKVLGFIYCDKDEMNDFLDVYNPGDTVVISGDLEDISNNTVPNTFNYKKHLTSNKIYSVVQISDIRKVSDNKNIFYSLKNILIHHGMKLKKSYPYISSLIFGNNNYLDDDVVKMYRDNGVSHLFAISGLHISIFMVLLNKVLDKFKFNNVFRYIILILFLIFYMFLTNFSMSVMRGAIFTILIFVNKLFNVKISNKNLLIFTLCIILFLNPLYLNNVGLQYSFLVTFSLIIFSSLINGSKIKQLFMISFIAFLVSYPITINNFNQVNFLSVIYNMFFVPYVSALLLPLILIGYVFPVLDTVIYFFVQIIETVSHFLNGIDILKISFCKMSVSMIVSYYVVILLFFKGVKKGSIRFFVIIVLFFIMHYFMPFQPSNYVLFFDVGQGDSSLISVNKTYTLIDTGGVVMPSDKEYTYKLTQTRLFPYFKSMGIRKIDNLVLTHGDSDHMKEAYYLVQNFKVENVIFNRGEFNDLELELIELLKEKGINYSRAPNYINVDKYKLEFLNTRIYDNENDNSVVTYFNYGNYKFLFMGDAGVEKEKDILDKYNISDVDFLKVGHHGSDTSSSKEFVDSISPKYSIISVGLNNRYDHPKESVLDNLSNSKVYRTDLDGSIKFNLKSNGYNIVTYNP